MASKAGKLRIAVSALLATIALFGCQQQNASGPPPRADDKVDLPPHDSIIAVPVEADLGELSRALEREVPRQLWAINKPDQVCVASSKVKVLIVKIKTPTLKCDLIGQVTRGPLSLSGRGQDLVVTMPINAVIRAKDIGGILKQETATASAQVRAIIRPSLGPDWTLRGKVNIAYDWTREPGIDFLGKRIEFTSKADAKLAGVIARLEQTLPRELAKVRLRDQVAGAWRQAFTSLSLNRDNPPVWLRLTPRELQFGGYTVSGLRMRMTLGLLAQTETFVGNRPADPGSTPLPGVRPLTARAGDLQFYIPVVADYKELEPVIAKALTKRAVRPFEVPGIGPVNATFDKITTYGTTGGRIAVGAVITAQDQANRFGKTTGTIWLTALPQNPANTRQVQFADLKISGETDSKGTNFLLKLTNLPEFSQTIADSLTQDFEEDFTKLMGKIARAIDEKREGRLLIQARITDVRTEPLKAAGQGLYLPVWGKGTAAIKVLPN